MLVDLVGPVGEGFRPGTERPPRVGAASSTVTSTPRSASTTAADMPAMPPPTTTAVTGCGTRGAHPAGSTRCRRTPMNRPANCDSVI